MERKINKLEHAHVEVLVTVEKEDWKKAQEKAFEKAASKVEIKGFRKGKAPLNLVKDRVNQGEVLNSAIDSLLPDIYKAIIEEDGIHPYAQPKVDVTKLTLDELEVKFTIVTAPEIELGAYKGLSVGKEEAKVTDEDVEKEINSLLEKNATLVLKEDKASLGDTVVIDFVGKVNGETFEGGSAENYELVLGSHSFIPGFEEQLVGHAANEHVDVNVTFPEQYTENLKGKPAVFECDIHEVKAKKLPTLDEEFVKEQNIPNVSTIDELKSYLRSKKLQEAEQKVRNDFINKVVEEINKNSKIDIPEEILDNQVEQRKQDFLQRMSQSGLSLEQYLQVIGQTEEQFESQLKQTAAKETANYLILEEIAKKEDIEVTDADIDFEIAKLADQYKMTAEDVKKAVGGQLDQFKNQIKMQRVENVLWNNND